MCGGGPTLPIPPTCSPKKTYPPVKIRCPGIGTLKGFIVVSVVFNIMYISDIRNAYFIDCLKEKEEIAAMFHT